MMVLNSALRADSISNLNIKLSVLSVIVPDISPILRKDNDKNLKTWTVCKCHI